MPTFMWWSPARSSPTPKIKIPNACIGVGVGVRYVTPFEMLRAERARFVIAS